MGIMKMSLSIDKAGHPLSVPSPYTTKPLDDGIFLVRLPGAGHNLRILPDVGITRVKVTDIANWMDLKSVEFPRSITIRYTDMNKDQVATINKMIAEGHSAKAFIRRVPSTTLDQNELVLAFGPKEDNVPSIPPLPTNENNATTEPINTSHDAVAARNSNIERVARIVQNEYGVRMINWHGPQRKPTPPHKLKTRSMALIDNGQMVPAPCEVEPKWWYSIHLKGFARDARSGMIEKLSGWSLATTGQMQNVRPIEFPTSVVINTFNAANFATWECIKRHIANGCTAKAFKRVQISVVKHATIRSLILAFGEGDGTPPDEKLAATQSSPMDIVAPIPSSETISMYGNFHNTMMVRLDRDEMGRCLTPSVVDTMARPKWIYTIRLRQNPQDGFSGRINYLETTADELATLEPTTFPISVLINKNWKNMALLQEIRQRIVDGLPTRAFHRVHNNHSYVVLAFGERLANGSAPAAENVPMETSNVAMDVPTETTNVANVPTETTTQPIQPTILVPRDDASVQLPLAPIGQTETPPTRKRKADFLFQQEQPKRQMKTKAMELLAKTTTSSTLDMALDQNGDGQPISLPQSYKPTTRPQWVFTIRVKTPKRDPHCGVIDDMFMTTPQFVMDHANDMKSIPFPSSVIVRCNELNFAKFEKIRHLIVNGNTGRAFQRLINGRPFLVLAFGPKPSDEVEVAEDVQIKPEVVVGTHDMQMQSDGDVKNTDAIREIRTNYWRCISNGCVIDLTDTEEQMPEPVRPKWQQYKEKAKQCKMPIESALTQFVGVYAKHLLE